MISQEYPSPSDFERDVVSLCQRLVRLNSVNPPGNELAVAQETMHYLEGCGMQMQLIPHDAQRASLLARLPGAGRLPGRLYAAHIDTVTPGTAAWKHEPFSAGIEDGKIWGRGTSDMKGGAAAMLAAARRVALSGKILQGDLVLALTAGEEVDFLGAASMLKHPWLQGLQAVFIAEPSSNEPYMAEKGGLWLELITYGKTAHGAMPQMGINAIGMMRRLLNEMEAMPVAWQEHPLLGGFTLSVNTIEGGEKTNVVPDRCRATVDIRTMPGQDNQAVFHQVQDLISRMQGSVPGFKAEARIITTSVPAIATSPDEPIVQQFMEVLEKVTGKRPPFKGVAYFTDAAQFVPALGIPMIICGPGIAALAHQPDEYVEIDKLLEAALLYEQLALDLLD